ncbi:MAG: hypothetical protein H0W89_07800, partial [Candidatus Levybacteria bacterium]|nr:hypothetical protein [Candidatus Levybacteria bacterium]
MPDPSYLVKPSLSFAKLVATPTDLAWSQAYNAGNLFVCLSLTMPEPQNGVSLQAVGRDIFNLLQSEFFVLEDKTAESIKSAIRQSMTKLPEGVHADLTLANFKEDMLAVFIAGSGKIVMKRGEKVGVLLESVTEYTEEITYASGMLQNADTIVLESGQFARGIAHEKVVEALELELPNDAVESLSPQMHEQENGAQAAIIIRYNHSAQQQSIQDEPHVTEPVVREHDEEPMVIHEAKDPLPEHEDRVTNEPEARDESVKKPFAIKLPTMPALSTLTHGLTHRRKLILSIAIILLILLGASVFLTIKKQNDDKRQALFKEIYTFAQEQYQAGQGLESLNPDLSRENYLKAQSKLKEGEEKIAKGTEEYEQIEALLVKVTSALKADANVSEETASLKEAEAPANSLLAVVKDNPRAKGFGQDANAVYSITADAIASVAKSNGQKKDVIENEKAWVSAQTVVPYQGNLYVLDAKNGVIKYTANEDGFTKSNYFTTD